MKIPAIPFTITDWNKLPRTEYRGERGTSFWRIYEMGDLRVRIVEYSARYKADHWCPRGHILLVLEGVLNIRMKDGRELKLTAGMGFQSGDDEANPHLARTERGAKVFIVD